MYSGDYRPIHDLYGNDVGEKHWRRRNRFAGKNSFPPDCTVRKIDPSNIIGCFFHPDCKFPEPCDEKNYYIHKTNIHGQVDDVYHTSYVEGVFSSLIFICEL